MGLIGHNGAGKTTLMQMIATLARPTCSRILLLFLFGLYVGIGAADVPALAWAGVGLVAAWAGHLWNRRVPANA